jgi:uncharacterized phage protein (TIGR01671 family)
MNREIIFKGKRVDNGEWIYGYGAIDNDILTLDFLVGIVRVECESGTVGQFTGLHDKNSKGIYEGDIVVCRQYIGGNFVEYCIERGCVEMVFGAFGLHRKQGYYRPFKDWLEDYELEVIGNIHDNPELLKEGTDE